MNNFFQWIKRKLGGKPPTLKESVEEAIEEHQASQNGYLHEDDSLLKNALNFSELSVDDVMIPRSDIIAVDINAELEDFLQLIQEKTHTRMPIIGENLDDVKGFIHIKDLVPILAEKKPFALQDMMREALFVPPSMQVKTLLLKMQVTRTHMAIVVDEYGGVTGLVTFENLIEEIVGEIEDEHDVEEEELIKSQNNRANENKEFEASARISIEMLEGATDMVFREEDGGEYDTLGGLIFNIIGRIPVTGEIITHQNGVQLKIIEADPRQIKRVSLMLPAKE